MFRQDIVEIVSNFEFGITHMGKYLQMGVDKTRNKEHSGTWKNISNFHEKEIN